MPAQSSYHHVGPITEQIVYGHAHGVNPIFELLNHILLVAPLVGQSHDLLGAIIGVVSEVEEVFNVFQEHRFPFLDADVFAHHNQPITAPALEWLIIELSHTFAQKLLVQVTLKTRSEEHTSELQSHSDLVCRLLLEKKKYSAMGFN